MKKRNRIRMKKILAAAGPALRPGKVAIATVVHDDDCPRINGCGECRCTPEVRIDGKRMDPERGVGHDC